MKFITSYILCSLLFVSVAMAQTDSKPQVTTASGVVEGINDSGVHIYKGIPFARPPVGNLRWQPPQPAKNWTGVREATEFGPGCMQRPIFGDMVFRYPKISEDCLYLNVWSPANKHGKKLPVLVYFYGGGFQAGDGSEPRYDGESMARNDGIVTVTANYRLNVFGFFAYPELAEESPHHASGNYGLLDQVQVLRWVKQNIAAFGGDPNEVTIAGESAGSMSVCGLMASPLSKNLFRGAIGESGGLFGNTEPAPLSVVEARDAQFAKRIGANSLKDLRNMSAEDLLKATAMKGTPFFFDDVDGYFLPKTPQAIFEAGQQAHVPLLLGWNSEEMSGMAILRGQPHTPENFKKAVDNIYGDQAGEILKLFPHANNDEVMQSATSLAGDRFTVFSTWKWGDLQSQTGGHPVYRYYYSRPRPALRDTSNQHGPAPAGAVHSAEIEYLMGNLYRNRVYDWKVDDYKVSHILQNYAANFVKTGNPNGLGLPVWEPLNEGNARHIMHIDVHTRLEPVQHRQQLLYLDQLKDNRLK